jgi:zinc transporter ZupT
VTPLVWTLLLSFLAAIATLIGGLVITIPASLGRHRLSHVIAFGAGYMLSAAFVSMLPESIEIIGYDATTWILGGYVLAHLFEHAFTSHFHFGEETHTEHALMPGVGRSALVGLLLHSAFDGVAISAGFLVSTSLGLFIALAVILHKIPEGVTIASVTLASGGSRRWALGATGMLAVATIVGAITMSFLEPVKGIALAISCGIAIYVAATDLIPELNKQEERSYSVSALAGILLFFLVHWLMMRTGLHG